jgi:hypothetical protein
MKILLSFLLSFLLISCSGFNVFNNSVTNSVINVLKGPVTTFPRGVSGSLNDTTIRKIKSQLDTLHTDSYSEWRAIAKEYFNNTYDSTLPDIICYIDKNSANNIKITLLHNDTANVTELFGEHYLWALIFSNYNLLSNQTIRTVKIDSSNSYPSDTSIAEIDKINKIISKNYLKTDSVITDSSEIDNLNTNNILSEQFKKFQQNNNELLQVDTLTHYNIKTRKLKAKIDTIIVKKTNITRLQTDSLQTDTATIQIDVLAYELGPRENSITGIINGLISLLLGGKSGGQSDYYQLASDSSQIQKINTVGYSDSLYVGLAKFKLSFNTENRIVIRPPKWAADSTFSFISYNFGNFESSHMGLSIGLDASFSDKFADSNRISPYLFFNYYLSRPEIPINNMSFSIVVGTNFLNGALFHQILVGGRYVYDSIYPVGLDFGANLSLAADNIRRFAFFVGIDYGL